MRAVSPSRIPRPGHSTCRLGSFRIQRCRTQGESDMTGSGRSLLRQASVLIAVCSACAVAAGPAFAQDRAPEPAPTTTSTPRPEPPPSARRQPDQTSARRVTPPPAPPPAQPTTPPPAFTPPSAPVSTRVVSQPPPASVRRESRVQRREPAKPRSKPKSTPKPERPIKQVAVAPLPGLSREEATSPDTMLLLGGLALFFLVLADMVFLTLSTRVLRTR